MTHDGKKLILLAGDIAVLYASLFLTLALRYQRLPQSATWEGHFWPFTIIFIGWIFVFYVSNFYNLHTAVNNAVFFRNTGKALLLCSLLAVGYFYLLPHSDITPKTNLAIYLAVFALLFLIWRQAFNWVIYRYIPKQVVAFIGSGEQVLELVAEIERKPQLGYRTAFIVPDDATLPDARAGGVRTTSSASEIADNVRRLQVGTIVLSADPHRSTQLRSILFSLLPLRISFTSLPTFYETITGRVPIEAISQMWFLENLSEGNKRWFDSVKRAYDILLAVLIIAATALFWPLIALAIKAESRGPALFTQKRIGLGGQVFNIIKFRTMHTENNDQSPTTENDRRVTGFGRFLRRTRIDELPQAINVMLGDMSFVGPRPERPELAAELEKTVPFYRERLLVKPGLTGWDQISGEYHSPSREDTLKKLQYDLFYIKNRSLYLDASILLKTIRIVLSRGGV